MKIKKMSFVDIQDTMCKEEMKAIMGGSGTEWGGTGGGYTHGGASNTGSFLGGHPSFQTPAGQAAWASSFSTPSGGPTSSNTGSSYSSGSYSATNYNNGWKATNNSVATTDPVTISRFFDFLNLNNNAPTGDQMNTFINNEATVAGQQANNLQLYGAIQLNNVNVVNYYKGPSTIPQGAYYENGVLQINNFINGGNINTSEQPVNLFADAKDPFNGVVNSRSFIVGDGKFTLFGHGAPGFILDQRNNVPIRNAVDFDKVMSMMNGNWNAAKDKQGTVLSLWSCQSGTREQNNLSIAQLISLAHPNIIVTAVDGFANYAELTNGQYKISGVDTVMNSGKNDGFVVGYRNGVELYRRQY